MRQAWTDTIRSAYLDQVISSERALQVHFAARLMDIFWEDGIKRRGFVEPMMQLQDGRRIHPDLLICNRNSIIGVVELKYQPKMPPKYAKDFATFESLADHGTGIEIHNRRYRGPDGGAGRFALSADPMYVWAGVYRGPLGVIPDFWPQSFNFQQLLVLHAATQKNAEPEIVSVSGRRTTRF